MCYNDINAIRNDIITDQKKDGKKKKISTRISWFGIYPTKTNMHFIPFIPSSL